MIQLILDAMRVLSYTAAENESLFLSFGIYRISLVPHFFQGFVYHFCYLTKICRQSIIQYPNGLSPSNYSLLLEVLLGSCMASFSCGSCDYLSILFVCQ